MGSGREVPPTQLYNVGGTVSEQIDKYRSVGAPAANELTDNRQGAQPGMVRGGSTSIDSPAYAIQDTMSGVVYTYKLNVIADRRRDGPLYIRLCETFDCNCN